MRVYCICCFLHRWFVVIRWYKTNVEQILLKFKRWLPVFQSSSVQNKWSQAHLNSASVLFSFLPFLIYVCNCSSFSIFSVRWHYLLYVPLGSFFFFFLFWCIIKFHEINMDSSCWMVICWTLLLAQTIWGMLSKSCGIFPELIGFEKKNPPIYFPGLFVVGFLMKESDLFLMNLTLIRLRVEGPSQKVRGHTTDRFEARI